MRISTIAFANLKRRRDKALFVIFGMAIGIGTVVALWTLSNSIKEEIGVQLDRFGANIIVVPKSNALSLDYAGITVSGIAFDVQQLKNDDSNAILEIPYRNRLSIIAPKILGAVQVEGQEAVIAGINFSSELKLKRWWQVIGNTPEQPDEVLVGHTVAERFSLIESLESSTASEAASNGPDPAMAGMHHATTDANKFRMKAHTLKIAGTEHRVAGVIAGTGGREDSMIFGSLEHVQSLLKKPDQLSLIEVSALCKDCPVEDIVSQIGAQLPHAKVSAIQQSARARTETVERLSRFSAAISAVVLVIGGLMIFTTVTGSVVERTKEIGVMRALGFRKSHIIKGLMIEASAISAAGGFLGWVTGVSASWIALPYFSQTGIRPEINAALVPAAIVAALIIGVLSSLYPAIRASRLDPCEAIRAL